MDEEQIGGQEFDPSQLQGACGMDQVDGVLDSHGFTKEQIDERHASELALLEWQQHELSARVGMWSAITQLANAYAAIAAVVTPCLQTIAAAATERAVADIKNGE